MNWIDAIRGTVKTTSPFEYSAKLTEIMLLGVVALNAARNRVTNGARHAGDERRGLFTVPRIASIQFISWLVLIRA